MGSSAYSYEEARHDFVRERPTYERLVSYAVGEVERELAVAGVHAEVSGRVKEVPSYLAKYLRDEAYRSGKRAIQDKAGVRITLPYLGDAPAVDEILKRRFAVVEREETVDRLGADKLGYLAVHYILQADGADLSADDRLLFKGLDFEAQVGSLGQRAWAEVSHGLLYKTTLNIPPLQQRMMNRLAAVIEIFDAEVERCRVDIRGLDGFEESVVLEKLDRDLLQFTGIRPDRALSQRVGTSLVRSYRDTPLQEVYTDILAPWIAERRARLSGLFELGTERDQVNPMMFQPEVFVILERSERDPSALLSAWPTFMPIGLLESLTERWGSPIN